MESWFRNDSKGPSAARENASLLSHLRDSRAHGIPREPNPDLSLLRMLQHMGDSLAVSNYEDVKNFHRVFRPPGDTPRIIRPVEWSRRIRLILEETSETATAYAMGDLEGFADGLIDLTWVVMGTAVEAGLPWERLWNEVRRANMDKFKNGVNLDSNGKVIKPKGWRGPDIARAICVRKSCELHRRTFP